MKGKQKTDKCNACGVCGSRMGEGCLESFGIKIGSYRICTSCQATLTRKGFLSIDDNKTLLPNGTIVTEPAETTYTRQHPGQCPLCHQFCKFNAESKTWYCGHCYRVFPHLNESD